MGLGCLTLNHTIPTFNDHNDEGSGKTLWEKEKMLVTTVFSAQSRREIIILTSTSILSIANASNLDETKILLFRKELTLYLLCQFWACPIQQQIKIRCQKF